MVGVQKGQKVARKHISLAHTQSLLYNMKGTLSCNFLQIAYLLKVCQL